MKLFVSFSFREVAGKSIQFRNCILDRELPTTEMDLMSMEVQAKQKLHLAEGHLTILYYREM